MNALVYGLGIAGQATTRALLRRGWSVVVADDRPSDASRAAAAALGVEYVTTPGVAGADDLLSGCDLLAPSPGVPETHPVIAAAANRAIPVRSEIDLAFEWEQARPGGARPMLAVTGTDGKTTTTLLAVEMLRAAGLRAVDAGNTDTPLVSAIDEDHDAFVVECTSFRLQYTTCFAPRAAVWLNFAPDHLDWHTSLGSYRRAKARIWRFQGPGDVAIGFAADPVVSAELATAPGQRRTFALSGADYHREGEWLAGPEGRIVAVDALSRRLPHDLTNTLAASALVLEAGLAGPEAISAAVARFTNPRHRIELIRELDGVGYYDDSKATTPHAALNAIRAFPQVVLIAGGRNKDLDLAPVASAPAHVRAVVAIGDAGPLIAAAFAGVRPVHSAASMGAAVSTARRLAQPGDAVLLSPGCASFDWYSGYPERGDDFARCVRELDPLPPSGDHR